MAKKQRPDRKRNPVAHHLFINRGGVHEKSNSAKRQGDKRQLRKLVDKAGAGDSGPCLYTPLQEGKRCRRSNHTAIQIKVSLILLACHRLRNCHPDFA